MNVNHPQNPLHWEKEQEKVCAEPNAKHSAEQLAWNKSEGQVHEMTEIASAEQ